MLALKLRGDSWAALGLVILASGLLGLPVAATEPELAIHVDQHGNRHRLPGADGQWTLLDFAASWCAPCREAIPYLEELAQSHPNLRILVIDVDEEREDADRFIEELNIQLPVVWDEGYSLAEFYAPKGMPATVLLNPAGEVVYSHVGFSKRGCSALEKALPETTRQAAAP